MTREKSFKKRVFEVIQIGNRQDIPSRVFDYIISVLVLAIIVITFAMTFPLDEGVMKALGIAEMSITCVFGVEYILRLWTCGFLYEKKPVLRFVFSFYGMIDLLTIVAYFIPTYSGIVALRLVRVFRILNLFKVKQGFDAFNVIGAVLKNKRKQLLSSVTVVLMLIMLASMCMYSFEHDAQPDKFQNGFSGIWWAVSAILTVGYGDIYPVTIGGEIFAILISLLGVCVVAIPTGIISAGFVEYYTKYDSRGLDPKLLKRARDKKIDVNEVLREYLDEHGGE